MFFHQALDIRLIYLYILAILLLPGFFRVDTKVIRSKALCVTNSQPASSKGLELSHGSRIDKRHEVFTSKRVATLEVRSLVKRGSCLSRAPNTYICSSTPPTVAECIQKIRSHGLVGSRISIFYTVLGGQGGKEDCLSWFECRRHLGDVVYWDYIVGPEWFLAQAEAIGPGNATATYHFQKRMSQAFAEASAGDAYICTPENDAPTDEFNNNTAWEGKEYPSLTRNTNVNKIVRFDPFKESTRTICTRGDPPTPDGPQGR